MIVLTLSFKLATQVSAEAPNSEAPPPRITYEDLLTRPDDLRLAFDFAKQEVRDGNVLSAMSTLERMLMMRPDLHDVRLFYAVLLYRLDNLAEAKVQLDLLEDVVLPPALAQEVERYRGLVADGDRPLTASLTAGLGLRYDGNRNGANAGNGLFFDLPVTFLVEPQDDLSQVGYLSGRVDYDLGLARPMSLFVGGTVFDNRAAEVENQDFSSAGFEAGVKARLNLVDLTLRGFGQYLRQDDETYQTFFGLEARADYQAALGTDVYGLVRAQDETFHDTALSPLNSTRDGGRYHAGAGLNHSFAPNFQVGFDLYGARKEGEVTFESYWRAGAVISPLYLLGAGQYISLRVYMDLDFYDNSDPLVTSFERRQDRTQGFSLTYGLPAATLAGWMDESLEADVPQGLGLAFTLDGRRRYSNVENYDYQNFGAQTMITYRLTF